MSREFGDYDGDYFHGKVANAASDARGGNHPLTLAWGKVLEAMQDVAWSISSVEAGDSSGSDLQIASVKALRAVRDGGTTVARVLMDLNVWADSAVGPEVEG